MLKSEAGTVVPVQTAASGSASSGDTVDADAAAESGALAEGLIHPNEVVMPPMDTREIIEKTVAFVTEHGRGFEKRMRQKRKSTFGFLDSEHPYNRFYEWRLQCESNPLALEMATSWQKQQSLEQSRLLGKSQSGVYTNTVEDSANAQTVTGTGVRVVNLSLKQRIQQKLALMQKPQEKYVKPVPHKRFIVEQPIATSALELDVIKLTAQFTACNGKSFVRDLLREERENALYAFLSPVNARFQYFTRLVDAYRVVVKQLDAECADDSLEGLLPETVLASAIGAVEFEERRREEAHADDGEDDVAAIDWEHFVVLDTVDFLDEDMDGLIVAADEIHEIDAVLEAAEDALGAFQTPAGDVPLVATHMDAGIGDDDAMDMESEESSSFSPTVSKKRKSFAAAGGGVVADDDLDSVPRLQSTADAQLRLELEKLLVESREQSTAKQKCPVCGELVDVRQISEHVKIELLNPKWKEQKEALRLKLMQSALAANKQIAESLDALAVKQKKIYADGQSAIGKPLASCKPLSKATTLGPMAAASAMQQPMRRWLPLATMRAPIGMQYSSGLPPPSKRTKVVATSGEPALGETFQRQPETEWVANHPSKITVKVQVPSEGTRVSFKGQMLKFTMNVTDTVDFLKERIAKTLEIPKPKQQLREQTKGYFLKTGTLAFYNVDNSTVLLLLERVRGGRKRPLSEIG